MDDDDDDDFELGLSPVKKKTSPVKGRRANLGTAQSKQSVRESPTHIPADDDLGFGNLNIGDNVQTSPSNSLPPSAPPRRSRKTGGWAESSPSQINSNSRRTSSHFAESFDDERLRAEFSAVKDESDEEIPHIPDLDDVTDEMISNQVAVAPQVTVNKVSTYNELDTDLLKHAAFSTLDNIDLRLLTKFLSPEHEVIDDDLPRSWDLLFTEVSSALSRAQAQDADMDTSQDA